MTDLDRLNEEVTKAIFEMEMVQSLFQSKCLKVALAEASLAHVTSSMSVEGEIARRGTISALLKANHRHLALKRVVEYLKEDLRPEVRAQLEAMKAQAEVESET